MSEPIGAPRRLLETHGAAGDCLRRAQRELPGLSPPRFAELRERRLRRIQRRGSALLVGVAAVGLFATYLRRDEHVPGIRAEPTGAASASPAPARRNAVLAVEPATTPAPKPAATTSRSSRPHPTSTASALTPMPPPAPAAPTSNAKACAALARRGDNQLALDCYAELSSGDGLSAELALFEAARLEGNVLHKPERALRILEQHRQRFPNGSLRGEVLLAQIGWLLAAGDESRARALVDEALASGLLRERTAELERLRDKLARQGISE